MKREGFEILNDPFDNRLDESTIVFPPFYTNFGRFIQIGKNVFINHVCSFLDMGGITIEDHILIGRKVNLITENHPAADAVVTTHRNKQNKFGKKYLQIYHCTKPN